MTVFSRNTDVVFVNPGDHQAIYQSLGKNLAAKEPPIWSALMANALRKKGYTVQIIDQIAENLSHEDVVRKIGAFKPKITAISGYGHQPSASTQVMTSAETSCDLIREAAIDTRTLLFGGHPSALPEKTLNECDVDFVCQGEGLYTLMGLLSTSDLRNSADLKKIPGLWFRDGVKTEHSDPAKLISQSELTSTLPGMAWDLLPMGEYRAHNWHCFDHIHDRQPYASIYTSIGCPYKCSFCCINAPFGGPDITGIRYWEPTHVISELEILAKTYGVKNVKIADEMFVLNLKHVEAICDGIIEKDLDFNIWAYARVDTVNERLLGKMKKAGINWLCLGIESKSKHVRDGVSKGSFKETDISETVKKINDSGIYVIGNYIFGLPDDNYDSMQDTLDLSLELNCEFANFYSAMAYPGSKLYLDALQNGWKLPENWEDFSQHSENTLPLPTEHLTAAEVLKFRDHAWEIYFKNTRYLKKIETLFGETVLDHIHNMTSHKLKRKLLETL